MAFVHRHLKEDNQDFVRLAVRADEEEHSKIVDLVAEFDDATYVCDEDDDELAYVDVPEEVVADFKERLESECGIDSDCIEEVEKDAETVNESVKIKRHFRIIQESCRNEEDDEDLDEEEDEDLDEEEDEDLDEEEDEDLDESISEKIHRHRRRQLQIVSEKFSLNGKPLREDDEDLDEEDDEDLAEAEDLDDPDLDEEEDEDLDEEDDIEEEEDVEEEEETEKKVNEAIANVLRSLKLDGSIGTGATIKNLIKEAIDTAVTRKVARRVKRKINEMSRRGRSYKFIVKKNLQESIDKYLSYVAKRWVNNNRVTLTENIQNRFAGELLGNIRGFMLENNVHAPRGSARRVFARLERKNANLTRQLQESKTVQARLQKKLASQKRYTLAESVANQYNMTATQREYFTNSIAQLHNVSGHELISKMKSLANVICEGTNSEYPTTETRRIESRKDKYIDYLSKSRFE